MLYVKLYLSHKYSQLNKMLHVSAFDMSDEKEDVTTANQKRESAKLIRVGFVSGGKSKVFCFCDSVCVLLTSI